MWRKSLIEGALAAFRSSKGWADQAVAQLPDDKLHIALDPNTNCIAVIMRPSPATSDPGGPTSSSPTARSHAQPGRRVDGTITARDELIADWESGWQRLFDSLAALAAGDVGRTMTIRGEPHTVPLAIRRSLAHCGYHVGQIVLIARILAGDHWTTITIPRGTSTAFNQRVWGKGHDQSPQAEAK